METFTVDEIKEMLKKDPSGVFFDKNMTKYEMVSGKIKKTPVHFYNSNENLEYWQEKLLNESSNYPVLEELESSWVLLESDYNQGKTKLIDRTKLDSESPLNAFMYMVDMGFYPPPEVLLSLLDCFKYYFDAKGGLPLEHIFFGKPEKGIGNHSAQKARKEHLTFLHFSIAIDTENKSQYQIAEYVIDHLKLKDDPESLLRQYRRFKKRYNLQSITDNQGG